MTLQGDDLPERFGNPNSVWKRFDRWCTKGVWEELFRAIGEEDLEEELEEVLIDSTTIKAHPVASTGRREAGEKKKRPTPDVASVAHAGD